MMGIAPKPSGFSNTKAGKTAIIERTKKLLDESSMVISLPFEGVTKEEVDMLRREIPKTAKAAVVKNRLMQIAVKETPFEPIAETIKNENMFFFIPEGEAKPTYEGYKRWAKEIKRTDPELGLQVAVMEGQTYTGEGLKSVCQLPTKLELITKIAQGIKAVPTKVGKGVKAVPDKLGRAIAAVKNQLEEQEGN
jgi:large subunit ribosomal protein L10